MSDHIRDSIDQIFPPEPPDDPAPEPPTPADDEIERLLAMSDEEILAEARADGIDVDEQAREMAAQFEVIARLVRERDQARELLGRSWLRAVQHTRETKRAVALLRAVERLSAADAWFDAFPETTVWQARILEGAGGMTATAHQANLTDALIALAAQMGALND